MNDHIPASPLPQTAVAKPQVGVATTSPTVEKPKVKGMSFGEAMAKVILGKKITKLEWNDKKYYALMHETKLMLHQPDGTFHPWTVSEGDLVGTDWVVLEG